MKQFISALFVTLVASFLALGLATSANADGYGGTGVPSGGTNPPQVSSGAPAAGSGTTSQSSAAAGTSSQAAQSSQSTQSGLPGTGGPNELLLVGALGLLAVGGVSVVASRRRRSN